MAIHWIDKSVSFNLNHVLNLCALNCSQIVDASSFGVVLSVQFGAKSFTLPKKETPILCNIFKLCKKKFLHATSF
jgi:hypothetical protein